MKKLLVLLTLCIIPMLGFTQQEKDIDSTAIFILDQMSNVISNLKSATFEMSTSSDKLDASNNLIKLYGTSVVTFSGPDKLLTRTEGANGKKGFLYDGEYLTYYNFDENNYVTLEAPSTTIEMIEQMHDSYDFKFPAADFFYPDFTDDVIENYDSVKFLGKETIDNEECYHIMANNDNLNVQIWVSNKTYLLPKHFVIIYKNQSNLQYQSTFSNWSINPDIPDAVFSFLAPPKAKLISILKKS